MRSTLVFLLIAVFAGSASAEDKVKFFGDARVGFFSNDRDDRDGSQDTTDEFRLRIRGGVKIRLSERIRFKGRLAGRYSTDDRNRPHFEFFSSIPSGDGLRRGDSTVDTLLIDYRPNKNWKIRAGRLQTSYELQGVGKKSLDRNNSPNTDINWVDGVEVNYNLARGWIATGLVQYNPSAGPTEVRRSPLNFRDDGSRFSYFASFHNDLPHGRIVQRAIDFTYLPDALLEDGSVNGDIEDYWVLVARTAAKWPLTQSGTDFLLGLELGYAGNTPTEQAIRTGNSGDSGGAAGQITFNFLNIVPKHSLGIIVGAAEGGYLLSPDFRSNSDLLEARYKWAINKKSKFEARLRRREELDKRVGARDKREDVDFYLRYTIKF